ncbi:putative methionyl-tRNA synthetase [Hordeum vulgare]|nr:putative methionyl-tRNA synthetase [Hordeum vulgare]
MSNHWSEIQTACNNWHGIVEEVVARLERGTNVEGHIESCEKWTEVRLALARAKETYNPDAPTETAIEGHPNGNKRAKTARDAAPTTKRLQYSVEQCIVGAKNNAAKREEKPDARWSELMTKHDVKLNLLKINVAAKKRNTDLAFLMEAHMSTMDEQVKSWYIVERSLILNQMPVWSHP